MVEVFETPLPGEIAKRIFQTGKERRFIFIDRGGIGKTKPMNKVRAGGPAEGRGRKLNSVPTQRKVAGNRKRGGGRGG